MISDLPSRRLTRSCSTVCSGIRMFLGLGCLVFVLSGCVSAIPILSRAARVPVSAPAVTSAEKSTPFSREELSSNRLLILGGDGNLSTVDPDGSNRFNLTTDASAGRLYNQPTWSTDGSRIAYTEVDARGRSSLVTVKADGSDRLSVAVPFAPFFYFWNPAGEQLAYLSNWVERQRPTIALRVASFDTPEPTVTTLSLGQPLYFSWSPDGRQLITHAGNRETALVDLSGQRTILAQQSANFATPQWLRNGQLLYTVTEGGTQQIVLADEAGEFTQQIGFRGLASFFVSNDNRRLAFVDTPQAIGTNAFGPLYLLELEDQIYRQLSEDPVIYFAWSPDGQALHYLTVEPARGRIWLRSHVWTDEGTTRLARFRPSAVFFEQYLRFADQYVQSQSYWAPDSRAIVYVGTGESGESGVWVQETDGESEPVRISSGVYATWSPQ